MKKLSLLLAITVLLTSIILPVGVSAATAECINETFENYTSSEKLLQTWQNKSDHSKTVNALGTIDGRGNVLKLETLGKNDTNGKKTTTLRRAIGHSINEGKLEISFSMMHDYNMGGTTNDRNMTSRIDIMGTDKNYESWLPLLTINGTAHDMYVGDAKNAETDKVMNVVSGTWYDVTIIYDVATQGYEITVTDGTTPVTKTGIYDTQYGDLLPTDAGVRAIRCATLGSWNDMNTVDGHGTMYLDNVKVQEGEEISDTPDPEPDTPDSNPVILADNFNNYADVNALMGVWLPKEGSKEAGSISLGTGEDNTNAYKISRKNSGSSNIDRTETWLDTDGITSGEFNASFKMMSDYTDASGGTTAKMRTVISFVDKDLNRYIPVIFVEDGKFYSGVTAGNAANYLCESVSGTWYDVEIVFDAANMAYDVSVTDGSTVYTLEDIKGIDCAGATYNSTSIDDIGKLRVELWGGTVGYGSTTIDDVNIVYSTNAIDVQAADLTFEAADGEKNAYAATVSASTAKINIDFGTMMNEASLKASSVVLMNTTDDQTVAYNGELNGSVYTLNLPKLLVPGKNYSLTITTDVENMNNEPAESEAVFTFESDSGECDITFDSFAIGTNAAPTVAEILAANTAKVKMNVLNSTGIDKDLLLIVAYYNGAELADVVYEDCDVPYATYVNGIFEKDITLKSGVTADKISVFAWNKFSEMIPYTGHIEIPGLSE